MALSDAGRVACAGKKKGSARDPCAGSAVPRGRDSGRTGVRGAVATVRDAVVTVKTAKGRRKGSCPSHPTKGCTPRAHKGYFVQTLHILGHFFEVVEEK